MNKKFILVIILALMIAGFLFYDNRAEKEENYLPEGVEINKLASEQLVKGAPYYKDIVLGNISLENSSEKYALKNGIFYKDGNIIDIGKDRELAERILRLVLFYQWMKEDPLFFSKTLETVKFDKALADLKKEQMEFLKLNGFKVEAFPVRFLEDFSKASAEFRIFSQDVSEKNALRLLSAIKEVNLEYGISAEKLRAKLQGLDIDKQIKLIELMGDNYVTVEIMLGDLGKILKNAKIGKEETIKREECLNGGFASCERLAGASLKLPELKPLKESSSIFLAKKELNLEKVDFYSGPYLINSPCWQNKAEQYLYIIKECPLYLKSCFGSSQLATKSYFVRLFKGTPFDDLLLAQGVKVVPQRPTNPYTCNNLEFQPKVFTVDYFYRNYKNDFLFEKIKEFGTYPGFDRDLKKIIENGLIAEKNFFNEKYPSEEQLEVLADFYAFTYAELAKEAGAGEDIREEALNRFLVIRERFADFDLLVNYETYFLSAFGMILKIRSAKTSENYFYPIRSNYSLLFLGFSSSVWRSEDNMIFVKPDIRDMEQTAEDLRNAIVQEDYLYSMAEVNSELARMNILDGQTAEFIFGEDNLLKWTDVYNKGIDKMKFHIDYSRKNSVEQN